MALYSRQELTRYLVDSQKRLESIDLTVLNIFENAGDVFVHWKMQTSFKVLGKSHDVQSLRISHLRFDKQGKIVLHQDYWDSTSGLFEHMPYIGGILKWIKKRLHS